MKTKIVSQIICNVCTDKVVSKHRHDYQQCSCGQCALDGGTDYMKAKGDYIDVSVYSDDPHDKIRHNFAWGSYGKNGDQPLSYVKLCDMELAHIGAVLETQKPKPEIEKILKDEILWRLK